MNYILISGKRCSGKDTVASLIKEKLGKDTVILGFANVLKYNYAKSIATNEIDTQCIYEKLINEYKFKEQHRENLINLAKSEKIKHGDDIWVRRLLDYVKNLNVKTIIIPDFRFKVEFEYFRNLKAYIIRVKSDETVRKERGWRYDPKIDNDVTETDLDEINDIKFNLVVNNNYSIEHLKYIISNVNF